jgi:hypothetical protein
MFEITLLTDGAVVDMDLDTTATLTTLTDSFTCSSIAFTADSDND